MNSVARTLAVALLLVGIAGVQSELASDVAIPNAFTPQ